MLIEHGCFAGCELAVVSDEVAVKGVDPDLAVEGDRFDLCADEPVRDRIAGGGDTDRGELVDLADLDSADPRAQHRQLAQQLAFLGEPDIGDSADLGVFTGVDL